MMSLLELKKKVISGNLTLTTDEALDIPMILNQKKGQIYDYDWVKKTIWISIWDLEFQIIDEVKNDVQKI